MDKIKILITGATGFVGSRLTERLALGSDYEGRAAFQRYTGPGLARIARLPVELIRADLLDRKSLEQASKGCDIIVHLAYGNAGSEEIKRKITIAGTENLLKAALRNDVRKLIHFSTTAVYGTASEPCVYDESTPFIKSDDVYVSSKIEAEKIVWKYYEKHNIPAVVLRPPIIYGPYGAYWTVRIVKEIVEGAVLVNGGDGAANLVYVDNLIDAVLLTIEMSSTDGEAFNVVDDEQLTWKQIYQGYASKLGNHPAILEKSLEEIENMRRQDFPNDLKSWFVKPFALIPEIIQQSFRSPEIRNKMMQIPWLRFIKNNLSRQTLEAMKQNGSKIKDTVSESTQTNRLKIPSKELVQLYGSRARISNEKIKNIIGYRQRVPFSQALDLTYSWLQYQRLVD